MLTFFKYLLPHWFFVLEARRRNHNKTRDPLNFALNQEHNRTRHESRESSKDHPYSYDIAVKLLTTYGLDEEQVRLGSIPEEHLNQICDVLLKNLQGPRVVGVQIGTFVGLSLTHISKRLKAYSDVLMISIDPNIPHRGIINPTIYAQQLLTYFDLDSNVMMINGYSLHKNISNDGENYFANYKPSYNFKNEVSPINQLRHLCEIMKGTVHFVLIDGNHHSQYLANEVKLSKLLLNSGGLIIIDDIQNVWITIKSMYESLIDANLQEVYRDNRVGILKYLT